MADTIEELKKVCKHCQIEKDNTEYNKAGGGKWLQPYCKPCDTIRKSIYNQTNKEEVKRKKRQYYLDNQDEIKKKTQDKRALNPEKNRIRANEYRKNNIELVRQKSNQYRLDNLEKVREIQKKYYYDNHEVFLKRQKIARANKTNEQKNKQKEYIKEWNKKNKEKISEWRLKNIESRRLKKNEYNKNKLITDPQYKIIKNLRGRIYVALKKGIKSDTTKNLLGCSIPFFTEYFESLFTEGMSWERYLNGEIHIDHKIPCAYYDLLDPNQQRECFSWQNLQPLWAEDNLKKGATIDNKTYREWKKQ